MTSTQTPARTRGAAFADAVRAEGAKLWSLPATWLILAGTFALTIVLSIAFTGNADLTASGVSVLDYGVVALGWTQVGFFLLGVTAATSEYIGGQIRTTLIAVPDRIGQRVAASLSLTPVVFLAGIITVVAGIGTVLITSRTPVSELDIALAIRITLSAAGYLTLMAILSAAIGVLIRKAIPAASILLIYFLILSPLLQGQRWYFLPDTAAYTLWYATVPDEAPPALLGWVVVVAWTIALLIPSLIAAKRRDT